MSRVSGQHLVMFYRTDAFTTGNVLQALDAVTDGVLPKLSTTAYLLGEPARILLAYAGSASATRAQITSPGFL
jgi:hypothetical protein